MSANGSDTKSSRSSMESGSVTRTQLAEKGPPGFNRLLLIRHLFAGSHKEAIAGADRGLQAQGLLSCLMINDPGWAGPARARARGEGWESQEARGSPSDGGQAEEREEGFFSFSNEESRDVWLGSGIKTEGNQAGTSRCCCTKGQEPPQH